MRGTYCGSDEVKSERKKRFENQRGKEGFRLDKWAMRIKIIWILLSKLLIKCQKTRYLDDAPLLELSTNVDRTLIFFFSWVWFLFHVFGNVLFWFHDSYIYIYFFSIKNINNVKSQKLVDNIKRATLFL